ncbi:hypothetical protein HanHA300_Chr00c0017g0682851 [Helianthus annuus]|nr:hypothetical protein HanHA300_Chr00c0017g0682851 [Helianthus annuus]KAJ0756685.1 hypothetical protein HanLR1_Chr04g0129931 [Helianthus annuus]KAJ0760434.1 hypothetical protein HanOQP8_Chr04g0137961 [Helianthus annuus]
MNKSDPSIAADRSSHRHSYHRLQPSSRTFSVSLSLWLIGLSLLIDFYGIEEGVKVVEMLMVVEWQVVAAGGKWWRQMVVSECLCVCV